jgi:iron-sulfur cluster repair di-iron protein
MDGEHGPPSEGSSVIGGLSPGHKDRFDFKKASLAELIEHIVAAHHTYLRQAMPLLKTTSQKLAFAYAHLDPNLHRIHETLNRFHDEVIAHMDHEENVIFPFFLQVGQSLHISDLSGTLEMSQSCLQMGDEHDDVGATLAALRTLTEGFQPPVWADGEYTRFYDDLAELTKDLHRHIFEENDVLYPKVQQYIQELIHKQSTKPLEVDTMLLNETYTRLKSENGGTTAFGLRFYERLFENYPSVRPLFNTPPEEQHKKLMASIGVIVTSAGNPEALLPYLHAMGIRHVKYGTMNDHYTAVKENLLAVLNEHLSKEGEWTPAMHQAWDEALTNVASIMIDGANHPEAYRDEMVAAGYQPDGFKATGKEWLTSPVS